MRADMIITFTDAAKDHIQKMLENKGKNAAFRLAVKQTGCSGYMYVPEVVFEKIDSDLVIEGNNFPVYLDEQAVPLVQGTEIDYVKKGLGLYQLEFHNPNADSLCGCGESFNLKKNERSE